MTHETCILRLAVNQHQELRTAAHATNLQVARSACAYAIAQHATARQEESRRLLHNGRQDGRAIVLVQSLVINARNGEGKMAGFRRIACPRDYHLAHLCGVLNAFVQRLCLQGEACSTGCH